MIITVQMIRDKLAFKGPLTAKGLEMILGIKYADFARALSDGLARGDIKRVKVEAESDVAGYRGNPKVEVYFTDWKDDLAKDV